MNATIRDIAAKAGVSPTTVSLAFQPESRISDKTRQKVMRVADQMNYVPDSAARSLRSGVSDVIGFLVTDLANPFYARMIREVMASGRARGFETTVTESGWDPQREMSSLRGLVSARVRGMLVCLSERTDESLVFLKKRRIPFVLMDTHAEGYDGPFVGNDLGAAARVAAEHLLESGCQRMAMLTGSTVQRACSSFVTMEGTFSRTVQRAGKTFDSRQQIIEAGLTIEGGREAMLKLLDMRPDVDGVFCASDLCAIGAMTAADQHGRKPGVDIAIMGIDDLDISGVPRIGLTSIRQPLEELASVATGKLIDAVLADQQVVVRSVLEPKLVVRNSSRLRR